MHLLNRDIVIIGIQAWDIQIGSNCKNIATGFAEGNRVLYVNMPLDRKTAMLNPNTPHVKSRLEILKGKKESLVRISNTFWTLYPDCLIESINFLPDGKIFDYFNFINCKRFVLSIQKALKQLGFKDIILFNDSSMFLGYNIPELLNPDLSVYYIRDNLVHNPYWRKHGFRLEPKIIKKYDIVLTNSEYYQDYARPFTDKVYMVGQGCDITSFSEEEAMIPDAIEMKNIQHPIIGYIGHITSRRLDIDLLLYVAKQRPDMSFVLIGKEDSIFAASELHNLKNVRFLGQKKESEIPSYLKSFDIAINPQVLTPVTIGNYPRKIDEYLAMGKPVICMDTLAMQYFKGYVYLAKDKFEFNKLIDLALVEDSYKIQLMRKEFANSHSWINCNNLIAENISTALLEKKKF